MSYPAQDQGERFVLFAVTKDDPNDPDERSIKFSDSLSDCEDMVEQFKEQFSSWRIVDRG